MSTSRRTQRAPILSPTSIRPDRLELPTVIGTWDADADIRRFGGVTIRTGDSDVDIAIRA
jgi:hypothetical protein